jgi:hypothetical protein
MSIKIPEKHAPKDITSLARRAKEGRRKSHQICYGTLLETTRPFRTGRPKLKKQEMKKKGKRFVTYRTAPHSGYLTNAELWADQYHSLNI